MFMIDIIVMLVNHQPSSKNWQKIKALGTFYYKNKTAVLPNKNNERHKILTPYILVLTS